MNCMPEKKVRLFIQVIYFHLHNSWLVNWKIKMSRRWLYKNFPFSNQLNERLPATQNAELTCVGDVYNFIQIYRTKTKIVYIFWKVIGAYVFTIMCMRTSEPVYEAKKKKPILWNNGVVRSIYTHMSNWYIFQTKTCKMFVYLS